MTASNPLSRLLSRTASPRNVLVALVLILLGACSSPIRSDVFRVVTTKPNVPVSGIAISPPTMAFFLGDSTRQLAAVLTPSNASNKKVIWSSSDETLATVSASGKVTKQSAASDNAQVTITATSVDGAKTGTCVITFTSVAVHVKGVTINQGAGPFTLAENETRQLSVTFDPPHPTNTNIEWTSSDPSIADVDGSGLVTAFSNNDTPVTITVTTEDGGKTDSCDVKVFTPVTSITLDKTTMAVGSSGGTGTLKVTIHPSNASVKTVDWTKDSAVISLSSTSTSADQATVTLTGVSAGTARVTATLTDDTGSTFTAHCDVTSAIAVSGINFSQSTMGLVTNEIATVNATVVPTSATFKTLTWSSDSPNATVNSTTGVITAHSAGTATITAAATDGSGVTKTLAVSVTDPPTPLGGTALTVSTAYAGAVLAVDKTATPSIPYVAYRDGSGNGVVQKLVSGAWTPLLNFSDSVLISSTQDFNIALAVDGGEPWVAFSTLANANTALVEKHVANNWLPVGPDADGTVTTGSASVGQATYLSLAFDTGHNAFLGVVDNGAPFHDQKGTAHRFNGAIWTSPGATQTTGPNAAFISVGFDPVGNLVGNGDHYYMAFTDNGGSLLVLNYPSGGSQFLGPTQLPSFLPKYITMFPLTTGNLYIGAIENHIQNGTPGVYTYNRTANSTNYHPMRGSSVNTTDLGAFAVDERNDTTYAAFRDTVTGKVNITKLPGTLTSTSAGVDVITDVAEGQPVYGVQLAMDNVGGLYVMYETGGTSGGTITVKRFDR